MMQGQWLSLEGIVSLFDYCVEQNWKEKKYCKSYSLATLHV